MRSLIIAITCLYFSSCSQSQDIVNHIQSVSKPKKITEPKIGDVVDSLDGV